MARAQLRCARPAASLRPLVAGCAVGLAVSWNISNTGAIAETLGAQYDVGLATVGLLTSVAFFAEIAVMIPGGRAIDRFGARTAGLLALALCLFGNVLLTLTDGIVLALVLRWFVGLGVGLGFVAGSISVQASERVPGALAQGIYGGVALSGGGLALAIVPAVDAAIGWTAPYVTGAIVAALGTALAFAAPRSGGQAAGGEVHVAMRELATDGRIVRLGLLHSVSFGFSVVIGNWIVTLLERTTDFGASAAGVAGALILIMGVVGRPLGGWLAGGGASRTLRLVTLSVVLGVAATALLATSAPAALAVLAAAVVGLAAGLPFGATFLAVVRAFPTSPGAAVGAMNLYAVITIVVGTPLLGLAFSLPGDGRIGFAAVAAVWAVIGAATRRAPASGGSG